MTASPTDPFDRHARGLLLAGTGGMALTVDIPLIRLADGQPWSILMVRAGLTVLAALIVWAVWRSLTPRAPRLVPGRAGLAVAAIYGLGAAAFIGATFNTSTANLVFILAFNPVLAALLSWLFLGERPRAPTFAVMAAMIVGVSIIVWGSMGSGHLFGDMLAFAAALAIAAAITLSRASGGDMGFTPLVGAAVPFLLAAFMVSRTGYQVNAPWWIALDGGVVIPISFFCLAAAPRYIAGAEVGLFYLLETVLAPVWIWLIFAEVPSRDSLIGGALIVVSLAAHSVWQLRDGQRRRRAGPPASHPA